MSGKHQHASSFSGSESDSSYSETSTPGTPTNKQHSATSSPTAKRKISLQIKTENDVHRKKAIVNSTSTSSNNTDNISFDDIADSSNNVSSANAMPRKKVQLHGTKKKVKEEADPLSSIFDSLIQESASNPAIVVERSQVDDKEHQQDTDQERYFGAPLVVREKPVLLSPTSIPNLDANIAFGTDTLGEESGPLFVGARTNKKLQKNVLGKAKKKNMDIAPLKAIKKKDEYEITKSGAFRIDELRIGSEGVVLEPNMATVDSATSESETIETILNTIAARRVASSSVTPQMLPENQSNTVTSSTTSTNTNPTDQSQIQTLFDTSSNSSSSAMSSASQTPSSMNTTPKLQPLVVSGQNSPCLMSLSSASSSAMTTPSTASTNTPLTSVNFSDLEINEHSHKLGSGASATVYKVFSKKNANQVYALKKIQLYGTDIRANHILSEIKSLFKSVECPYIIRLFDAYHREGQIQLLLEFMDCGSLEDIYKTCGKIPEDVLSEIAFQILSGLAYLQSKGILHRDLKPSNILMNKSGCAKISDFGMSKLMESNVATKTFQGSYYYMSPERIKGDEHDFNSDVYSLGLTIAECALGKYPVNDVEKMSLWDVMRCFKDGITLTDESLSPELKEFVSLCCIGDRLQRPYAKTLLETAFIRKHNSVYDDQSSIKFERVYNFIHQVYLPMKEFEKSRMRSNSQPRLLNFSTDFTKDVDSVPTSAPPQEEQLILRDYEDIPVSTTKRGLQLKLSPRSNATRSVEESDIPSKSEKITKKKKKTEKYESKTLPLPDKAKQKSKEPSNSSSSSSSVLKPLMRLGSGVLHKAKTTSDQDVLKSLEEDIHAK